MKNSILLQLVTATILIYSSCKHEFQTIETAGIEKNVSASNSNELTECVEGMECEYVFHKNSIMFKEYGFVMIEIHQGEKNVFVYRESSLPYWTDFSSSSIYFEIDEDETRFSYENQQLVNIKAIFQHICGECLGSTSQYIENGIIKGEKMGDNKWYIEIDLPRKDFFPYSDENQRFIVKNMFSVK